MARTVGRGSILDLARYDGPARHWVVGDRTGEVARRFDARELSREAILGLSVRRKRGRRQES